MHDTVSSQLKTTLTARLQTVSFEIKNLLLLDEDDEDDGPIVFVVAVDDDDDDVVAV